MGKEFKEQMFRTLCLGAQVKLHFFECDEENCEDEGEDEDENENGTEYGDEW